MADWETQLQVTGISLTLISLYLIATSGWVFSVFVLLFMLPLGLCSLHAASLKPAPSFSLQGLLKTYVINCLLLPIFAKRAYKNMVMAMKNSQKTQDELLMKILAENSQTAFNKDHKLNEIKSRQEFRTKFPLTKFDTYEKYVQRIANGEKNVMTKAEVMQFCASSGTTGKNKLYPITTVDKHLVMMFGLTYMYGIWEVFQHQLNREFDFCLFHPESKTPGGLKISGIYAARKMPKPAYTTPAANKRIPKEGASYFVQAVFALKEANVDSIEGTSSDLLYAFFKSMEFNKEALVKAISSGHIDPYPGLEEDVRLELNQKLTPDPERAMKLEQELEKGSDALASRVWPLMKYVMVGKTGAFAHSAKKMENSYLKNITVAFGVHAATEGIFGCSMNKQDLSEEIYTFLPHHIFFEFIKVEDMEQNQPQTYLLNELEVGQMYEIVVTNWYGLYRNRFGDVIKVVGYTENSPKYTFQYRTGQILNCAFDRTPEQIFYEVVKMAEKEWNIEIVSYTSTESMHLEEICEEKYSKNHYVAFVETPADVKLTASHSAVLEEKLCERHQTYAEFREQDSVGPIDVIQVMTGTFDGLRSVLWGDRPNVQYKTPRVLRNVKALQYLWNNRIQ